MARDPFAMRRVPAQARSRGTVARILRAAAAVFDERGYDAATTTEVAARAGVSPGSLYQYFPRKEALLVALADAHVLDATRRWTGLVAGWEAEPSARRMVRRVVEAAIAIHGPDTRLHRALFHRAVRTDALDARLRALHAMVEDTVCDVLVRLGVTPTAVPLGARSVVAAASALLHEVVLADDLDRPHDERVTVVVDACLGIVDGLARRAD